MSTELVDDTNHRVQYKPGWIWDQGVAEVDATRHGASIEGLQAWLSFTGTGVRVIGTLGVSDTFGQPKTTFDVDGNVAGTYSAPHTGQTQYNVTFFSMQNLSPGDHIVRITNTDGTSPNTFWLDYFLIDNQPVPSSPSSSSTPPVDVQPTSTVNPRPTTTANPQPTTTIHTQPPNTTVNAQTTSTTSTQATSTSTVSSQTTSTISSQTSLTVTSKPLSMSTSSAGTSSVAVQYVTSVSGTETVISTVSVAVPVGAAQTSAANTTDNADTDPPPASHLNVGVIAGAAVAGVAVLAILAIVFLCLRRRRQSNATQAKTVAPFASSQDPSGSHGSSVLPSSVSPSSGSHPSMQYNSANVAATLPVSSTGHSSHRSRTAPPSEVASENVEGQSEFYTMSSSSGSALLTPLERSTSPSTANHLSATSEKSHRVSSVPDTPSLGFSTAPGTRTESLYTPNTPDTPASPAFSTASGTTSLMPPAVLPPGAWHAPPDSHGRAHTLLRSLFSRGHRAVPSDGLPTTPRDVDSGLRLYDDVVLPPPYTQD